MNYNKILLEIIYSKTGIYITNKNDCKLVGQYIVKHKIGYLSESTLYRFFLSSDSNQKPYINTLNILAQLCDFESWSYFLYYCDTNTLFTNSVFLNNTLDTIIKDLVVREKFNSLIDIFESVKNENYKTKEYIGLHTFINFQNTNSFPLFIEKHGHNSFVRNIIMEALYDPFHRIKGYAESYNYYLNFTKPQSKNYLQDFVFGNAVLFRYYYLNNDLRAIEFAKKLYDFPITSIEFDQIHLFPRVRYTAYKIWYLKITNHNKTIQIEYLDFAYNWICDEFKKTNSIIELNIINQTFLEVFQNQKLIIFQKKLHSLFSTKLKSLKNNEEEIVKAHYSNGLLNMLP